MQFNQPIVEFVIVSSTTLTRASNPSKVVRPSTQPEWKPLIRESLQSELRVEIHPKIRWANAATATMKCQRKPERAIIGHAEGALQTRDPSKIPTTLFESRMGRHWASRQKSMERWTNILSFSVSKSIFLLAANPLITCQLAKLIIQICPVSVEQQDDDKPKYSQQRNPARL